MNRNLEEITDIIPTKTALLVLALESALCCANTAFKLLTDPRNDRQKIVDRNLRTETASIKPESNTLESTRDRTHTGLPQVQAWDAMEP